MEIHERIRATRDDSDLTQQEVADAIGCTRKQVSRYETGEQEMTISKLRDLCLLFKVSADYILGLPEGLTRPR